MAEYLLNTLSTVCCTKNRHWEVNSVHVHTDCPLKKHLIIRRNKTPYIGILIYTSILSQLIQKIFLRIRNLVTKCCTWANRRITPGETMNRHIFIPSASRTPGKSTAAAKSLQSCPTLCDPTDSSPPGSPVPGILQARTLERVAISFSNAWTWKVKVKSLSRAQLLATPRTAAHQAPPSMGFSRQEYWSGVPLPSLGKSTEKDKSSFLKWNNLLEHCFQILRP